MSVTSEADDGVSCLRRALQRDPTEWPITWVDARGQALWAPKIAEIAGIVTAIAETVPSRNCRVGVSWEHPWALAAAWGIASAGSIAVPHPSGSSREVAHEWIAPDDPSWGAVTSFLRKFSAKDGGARVGVKSAKPLQQIGEWIGVGAMGRLSADGRDIHVGPRALAREARVFAHAAALRGGHKLWIVGSALRAEHLAAIAAALDLGHIQVRISPEGVVPWEALATWEPSHIIISAETALSAPRDGRLFRSAQSVIVRAEGASHGEMARVWKHLGETGMPARAAIALLDTPHRVFSIMGHPKVMTADDRSMAHGALRKREDARGARTVVSCGRPPAGVEVAVLTDDHQPCDPAEIGQLWVRGDDADVVLVETGEPLARPMHNREGLWENTGRLAAIYRGEFFAPLAKPDPSRVPPIRTVPATDLQAMVLDRGTRTPVVHAEVVRVRGALHLHLVERSIETLMQRHEGLRSWFELRGEKWVAHVVPGAPVPVTHRDLRNFPPIMRRRRAAQAFDDACRELGTRTRGPWFRVVAAQISDDTTELMIAARGVVADRWSLGILVRELASVYEAEGSDRSLALDAVQSSLDVSQQMVAEGSAPTAIHWWADQFMTSPRVWRTPTPMGDPRAVETLPSGEASRALGAVAKKWKLKEAEVLVSAVGVALAKALQRDDILLGVLSDRRTPASASTVGNLAVPILIPHRFGRSASLFRTAVAVRKAWQGALKHPVSVRSVFDALEPPGPQRGQPVDLWVDLRSAPPALNTEGSVRWGRSPIHVDQFTGDWPVRTLSIPQSGALVLKLSYADGQESKDSAIAFLDGLVEALLAQNELSPRATPPVS